MVQTEIDQPSSLEPPGALAHVRQGPPASGRPAGPAAGLDREVRFRLILIFVALVAAIAASGVVYYRSIARDFRIGVERQLESVADLKVKQLASWRAERMGDGRSLADNHAFSLLVRRVLTRPSDADARRLLLNWLGNFTQIFDYDQVRLIDAGGIPRLSIPAQGGPPSAATLRSVAEVLRTGHAVFQDLYRNERDNRIYLQVNVPVLDEQGAKRLLGVVTLRVDPARYLYPFIQSWPVSSGSAETLILRRDGNDVLFLNALRFQADAALALRVPLLRREVPSVMAVHGREGIMSGFDYRGVPVVSALRRIPDSPWFLVSKVDVAEVYAPLTDRLWQVIVAICLCVGIAGGGVVLLWWKAHLRQAQERLAIEVDRAKLSSIVDSSDDAIIGRDLHGVITSWNRGAERQFGYGAAETIGSRFDRLIPPELAGEELDRLASIARGGLVANYETERIARDGRRVPVSVSLSPIRDVTEAIVGVSSIARDITERLQAEEQRRGSEHRYSSLFNNMTEGYCHFRMIHEDGGPPDLVYLSVNEAFASLTGLREVEGRKISEVIPGIQQSDPEMLETFGRVARTGRPERFESFVKSLDMWFSISAYSPAEDEFVAVFDVITERKQAELQLANKTEELAKSNEELTRFNRLMTGRELRIVELKQRVNDLAAQLGLARPYPLAFLDAAAAEVVRTTPTPDEQDSSVLESPQGTSP